MKLGNKTKIPRKQNGLRQEQFTEGIGISTFSVSIQGTDQSCPEYTSSAELADCFAVSMDTPIGHNLNDDRIEVLVHQTEKAADG